jgi:amino acid permease
MNIFGNYGNFNNFNNLLIALFTILFCYILFYRIYKSCFGSKIIEGIDGDDKNSDPEVVTTESVEEEEEEDKKKSEEAAAEDAEKKANEANEQILEFNNNRAQANQPTPPSEKLLQARFS